MFWPSVDAGKLQLIDFRPGTLGTKFLMSETKLVIWVSFSKSLCVVAGDSGGQSHIAVHRLGHVWLVRLYLEVL